MAAGVAYAAAWIAGAGIDPDASSAAAAAGTAGDQDASRSLCRLATADGTVPSAIVRRYLMTDEEE